MIAEILDILEKKEQKRKETLKRFEGYKEVIQYPWPGTKCTTTKSEIHLEKESRKLVLFLDKNHIILKMSPRFERVIVDDPTLKQHMLHLLCGDELD